MRSTTWLCAAWTLAAFAPLSSARGDGDAECAAGSRPTTAAERAAMTEVLETVRRLAPPIPDGWTVTGDDQLAVVMERCRDTERMPWVYEYSRNYQKLAGEDERQAQLATVGTELAAEQKQKQPQIDALMARMAEVGAAAGEAAQKGDFARVEKLTAEADALGAEYERLLNAESAEARIGAVAGQAYADTSMTYVVLINPSSDGFPGDAVPVAAPPGAAAAKRYDSSNDTIKLTTHMVAFGEWRPSTDGYRELVPHGNAPYAPQAITVRMEAAPERLDRTVQAFDFETLGRLLVR